MGIAPVALGIASWSALEEFKWTGLICLIESLELARLIMASIALRYSERVQPLLRTRAMTAVVRRPSGVNWPARVIGRCALLAGRVAAGHPAEAGK